MNCYFYYGLVFSPAAVLFPEIFGLVAVLFLLIGMFQNATDNSNNNKENN